VLLNLIGKLIYAIHHHVCKYNSLLILDSMTSLSILFTYVKPNVKWSCVSSSSILQKDYSYGWSKICCEVSYCCRECSESLLPFLFGASYWEWTSEVVCDRYCI